MKREILVFTVSALALAGCASEPEIRTVEVPGPVQIQRVPVAVPTPYQPVKDTPAPVVDPARATAAAVRDGLQVPDPNGFIGAVYTPVYNRDFWYSMYVAVGDQSDIEWPMGETLLNYSCPDQGALFSVGSSYSGDGDPEKQPDRIAWMVHIKPRKAGTTAQCTFNTTRGPYRVKLIATRNTKHVALRWSQAVDQVVTVSARPQSGTQFAGCGAGSDENYQLTGDLTEWGLRVGDVMTDGKKTCIKFPPSIGATEGPTVWIVDGETRKPAQPTRFGSWYIIDGMIPKLEIRLGAKSVLAERGAR